MNNNTIHSCFDHIETDELLLCVDCGASYIKTLLLDKSGSVTRRYKYEEFPYVNIGRMMTLNEAKLILTGARSGELKSHSLPQPENSYAEIECLAELAPFLGYDRAVIGCVGTGTPFVIYDKGEIRHAGGTGIGGGAFQGLASRMLGITDPLEVERIAKGGDAGKVNLTVGDLYPDGTSYLRADYTAANFAKAVGGRPRDVAMGIHSLVSEVVGMMAAQIARGAGVDTILFCGGSCENQILCDTLVDCVSLFGLNAAFIEEPCFGTCYGAAAKYMRQGRG